MNTKAILRMALATGLLLAFAGCESLFSDDAETASREEMLAEYGGFDTGDELEAFGDADLRASYTDDPEYQDDMEGDDAVTAAYRHPRAQRYLIRVVWGNIQRPDTTDEDDPWDCPVTDWSGSLQVSGGVVVVRRPIRFETPADQIIRPRSGPSRVSWISHTQPHVDGILFEAIDVPEAGDAESANSVSINTPLYTVEIPFGELDGYREFLEIGECSKISIVATRNQYTGPPAGFVEGGWIAETDSSGYFRGGWISANGRIAGYLRGRYTVRDGRRVLLGKWITASGAFGGLMKGTWQPSRGDSGPDGFFEARWVDEFFIVRGVLRGHYHICPEGGAGFFHGHWKHL